MGITRLVFDPSDASFSRTNALYLAHAADVAYHRAPVTFAKQRLGLRAFPFRNPITRTRGYLGVCDTHAVLAFRGTDPITLPNWLTDVVVKLVACDEYDGRVHSGFHSALKRLWNKIEPVLDRAKDKPLFVTGHSMGGALAVLTACRLAKTGRAPVATYTFGAPRFGDAAFCERYALPTYRVVNRLDLVPEMPIASMRKLLPDKPRFTNEKILSRLKRLAERTPCYGHVNTLIYIDGDGVITPDADVEPWHTHALLQALKTRGQSFIEAISDHLISSYIRSLEGASLRRRVLVRRRSVE